MNKIDHVVQKFCAKSKVRLVGSAGDKRIKYPSDRDYQCLSQNIKLSELTKKIQDGIKNLGDTLYMELKTEIGKEKVRWTKNQILKGKKGKYTLQQALGAKGFKILDLIVPYKNKFAEVSVVYLMDKEENPEDREKELTEEMETFKKTNLFKALKRKISLLKMNNKKIPFLKFMNSETGKLSQLRNDLELILNIKLPFSEIEPFFKDIQKRLYTTKTKKIEDLNAKNYKTKIKSYSNYLLKEMNKNTKEYIKQNNIEL